MVAPAALVRDTEIHSNGLQPVTQPSRPTLPEWRLDSPPRPLIPPLDSMVNSVSIDQVLVHARKPSTVTLYSYKWRFFFHSFALEHNLPACPTTVNALQFLLLFERGFTISTLKFYSATVVTYQPPHSQTALLFRHPTLKQFFKGLQNIRP
ncbi:hypothetical protein JRQ81_018856 [Phrynocephalus forsythii]|uniref:Uncharacterized protein n=1 Tax=Phrynocephalus forsythii TaxID=171643 RepID=A0A9Q0XQD4_9SAUR|nr:hypothetical protein JRQ81_018856 [Phrynocephalus forsythii]